MTDASLLRPIVAPIADSLGPGIPLAGGPLTFTHVEIIPTDTGPGRTRAVVAVDEVPVALRPALDLLTARRPQQVGLDWGRPRLLGIVNVTPDSFSDGGDSFHCAAAVARGLALVEAGADMIDVGGESTRPGATPVDPAEERRRVVPVIRALAGEGIRVSIDTRHADTMTAALDAGALVLNDVTALAGDPRSIDVAKESGAPVILMHMQGAPQTMQSAPVYVHVVRDIFCFLQDRIAACVAAGLPMSQVIVDPGIGFGKTVRHNLEIMRHIAVFHGLGCPVAIGLSRKRFIAALSRDEGPKQRVAGSLAAALAAVGQGVQLLRVHDVAETAQALAVWRAIREDANI